MVLQEDEYDELVDDNDIERFDGLLGLPVLLSFRESVQLYFSGEECSFVSLAECAVQIPMCSQWS